MPTLDDVASEFGAGEVDTVKQGEHLQKIREAERDVQTLEKKLADVKTKHKAAKDAYDEAVAELRAVIREDEQPRLPFKVDEVPNGES
jgi:Holliday junction resolvase RusA-like endonuclease